MLVELEFASVLDAGQKKQLKKIRELRASQTSGEQVRALVEALGDPELQLAIGLEGTSDEAQAAMDAAPDEVLDELVGSLRLRSEHFRGMEIPGLDPESRRSSFVSLELDLRGWPDTKAFDYVRDAAALRVLARRPDHAKVRELVPRITRLFINGCPERRAHVRSNEATALDLSGLGALTSLRFLVVSHVLEPNGPSLDATELERVVLAWCRGGSFHLDAPELDSFFADSGYEGPKILGLEKARSVREIAVRRRGASGFVSALRKLHALEVLDLQDAWSIEIETLDVVRDLASLRVLKVAKSKDADALRDHSALEEARIPGLVDITPLAGLPRLRSLELERGEFTTLEPWRERGMPALEHLDVAQTSLATLDGIEACPKLKTLIAGRTDTLVNADALKDHPALTEVVLEGARALKSLKKIGKLPRLKRLALKGSKVTASRISDDVLEFVDPQTLVQKRRATLLAKKQGMGKPKRGQLGKLKKLLLTRDWEKMDLGIQLADSLDDPKIFDALTTGASVIGEGFPYKQGLVQNTVFKGPKVAPWRLYALLNLIAVAPEGTEAAKLREQFTSLMIKGERSARGRARMTYLHGFPNIRLLYVTDCAIIDPAAIEKLPVLEELNLYNCIFDGPVCVPPSVRSVELRAYPYYSHLPKVDVFGDMTTWSEVETLRVSHAKLENATALSELASVKSVSFTGVDLPEGAEAILSELPSRPNVHIQPA